MGRAQSDTYISLFNKSDNINLDENLIENRCLCTFLPICYVPMIAFDNINMYSVIIRRYMTLCEHTVQGIPGNILSLLSSKT